jgi:hypothetical protein
MRRWLSIYLLMSTVLVACGDSQAGQSPAPPAVPATAEERSGEGPAMVTKVPATDAEEPEPAAIVENATPPAHLAGRVSGWNTDWSRHTVPLTELFSGGPPRDGIPPLDNPSFISAEEAAGEVAANEPVVVFEHEGQARAYPLAILMWHEIVNDEVSGKPVTITFCPLCNTALAFDRRLDGHLLDFGTSGLLRHSDLVMWDRQTESLWQQVTGEAIVGELAGERLTFVPASILSFDEFRATYPSGSVLAQQTGFGRNYGANPYVHYDAPGNRPFLYSGTVDDRLPAMERVVGVAIADEAVAYPFSLLAAQRVVNDEVGEQPLVIFYSPATLSALDQAVIEQSAAVGSAVPYDPRVGEHHLTFEWDGGVFRDQQTGSAWDVTGRAIEGEMAGTRLAVISHANHFWFAFQAFYPQSRVWEP